LVDCLIGIALFIWVFGSQRVEQRCRAIIIIYFFFGALIASLLNAVITLL
jgi:hypothetical protein